MLTFGTYPNTGITITVFHRVKFYKENCFIKFSPLQL